MAHSDSDDFHSADEEVVSVTSQNKIKNRSDKNVEKELKIADIKEEQKSNKKDDGWGDEEWEDFDVGIEAKKNELLVQNSNKEVAQSDGWDDFDVDTDTKLDQKTVTQSKNDGWDDFNICNEPKICETVEQKPITQNKKDGWDDIDVDIEHEKVESQINQNVPISQTKKNDGWDDFDDWNDDKVIETENPTKLQEHSENEYKALADKLSSLGEVGGNSNSNNSGWGGWGGWGVTSLLTSGVSQISTHVSQGFASVSQAIETGIGIPDPAELAKTQIKDPEIKKSDIEIPLKESLEKDDKKEPLTQNDDNLNVFKIGKLVSSMTKLVESTGSAVVTGGLDTLEEIGKRTMRVLQGEEDGKKRLSTLLREARDHADKMQSNPSFSDENIIKKKPPQFEALFDDFQGLVHLEALEMLSKQCDMKIQSLLSAAEGKELTELKETLDQVKEICELPEVDEDDHKGDELTAEDFRDKLSASVEDMGIQLQFDPIVNCWQNVIDSSKEDLIASIDNSDEEKLTILEDLMNKAVTDLAQISALSVQLLHRSTALLSVQQRRSTADEADGLTQLTSVLMSNISEVANIYTQKLNKQSQECGNTDKVNEFITAVFVEAEKGSSYVQNAFTLTIPILQVGAT